jgi:hypothetical protein
MISNDTNLELHALSITPAHESMDDLENHERVFGKHYFWDSDGVHCDFVCFYNDDCGSEGSEQDGEAHVRVTDIVGKSFQILVVPGETVYELKQRIENDQGYEAQLQQLIFTGEALIPNGAIMTPNNAKCGSFNIKEGDQIRLIMIRGFTITLKHWTYAVYLSHLEDSDSEMDEFIMNPEQVHSQMTLYDLRKLITNKIGYPLHQQWLMHEDNEGNHVFAWEWKQLYKLEHGDVGDWAMQTLLDLEIEAGNVIQLCQE